MPIKVPDNLPTIDVLKRENIFIMGESRAFRQDIRPLKILVVNLMPLKQATEAQLFRLLSNSPLQIEVTLAHMATHDAKNTAKEYLLSFYKTFDEFKQTRFDGCVITGAPVEKMRFEDVTYWDELCRVMDWTTRNVTSTFHICWAAQAGLYHHYGVGKRELARKMFGIFDHYKTARLTSPNLKLLRGFDETFKAPHSRHTEIIAADVENAADLEILSKSDEAGIYLIASADGKRVFATGHSEYDRDTLHTEYWRDKNKGETIDAPRNYFDGDDPTAAPKMTWQAHANLLYSNWLNYYVYQETPYDLETVKF